MKKLMLMILLMSLMRMTSAQSFTATGASIPDHGIPLRVPLMVSALPASLSDTFGLEQVCLNIQHQADGNLAIYLLSPDGTIVELLSGCGGRGHDFLHTCFSMSASTLITTGTAPFTGNYVPRHPLGSFNMGHNGNGIWYLVVTDFAAGDTGSVLDYSLLFSHHPAPPVALSSGPCSASNPDSCLCPDGIRYCNMLPDMFIATSMLADTFYQLDTLGAIRITNSCANIGYGPMELIGTGQWFCGSTPVSGPGLCPDSTYSKQLVKQRIWVKNNPGYFDFYDTTVGYMQFHAALGHRHLHIDNWSQNTLRIKGPEADPSKWPIIASGNKVSFCVYDHLACGGTFQNCMYQDTLYSFAHIHNAGLGAGYPACGASVQGISVGYSDIYDFTLEGQDIPLENICNGNYYLVAEFDPLHHFLDHNRSNNISCVPITLRNQNPTCCRAAFDLDTLDIIRGLYQLVDRSSPIPTAIKWFFSNGTSDSLSFPIINCHGLDSLQVTCCIENVGCRDTLRRTFHFKADSMSGIQQTAAFAADVQLYPNPTSRRATLQFKALYLSDLRLEVLNGLGECIKYEQMGKVMPGNVYFYSVDLPSAGMYLIKLSNGHAELCRSIVSY
jgi:subtilisin-like proprotein convertase family protein